MPAHKVTLTPSEGKAGIEWQLCHKGPNTAQKCGPAHSSVIDVGRNEGTNKGDQVFTMTINDKYNLGLKFSSDPLWIQAGPKPTTPVIDTSQIHSVTPTPNKIIFKDRNDGGPVTLMYALNFLDNNNGTVTIDPAIKNGGTNIADNSQTTLLLAGAGLALLLAAIWLSIRSMRRRRDLNAGGRP